MVKKILFSVLIIFVFITAAVSPVKAADVSPVDPIELPPSAETGEMIDETPTLWFVELSNPPFVEGTPKKTLKAEKTAFRSNATKVGFKYTEMYSYETLWNGFSISATSSEINKLNLIPGVKGVFPVDTIKMPETTTADPELFTALSMTGADIVQSELGFTGAGIKVAVIDTGIDVNHPAFGGNGVAELNSTFFFNSPRILFGYDFVGDNFNADDTSPSFNPIPSPDPIPDDCAGHGTHVSGIIGANDPTNGMKGVAPDVTFGAYRVFGCQGSTTSDIMLLAMEQAYKDKMDVLNMSIGSAFNWPQYPTAVAASRLVERGMVVVASIGNSGANGLYAGGAPGLGEKVIGVASYDNTSVAQAAFSITSDGKLVGYNPATGAPPAPKEGTLEIAAPTPVNACPINIGGHYVSPFAPESLSGKAVLVNRGTCSFYWKALFAQQAGAAAVIIANNAAGQISPTVDPSGGAQFTPIACPHADFPTCPLINVPTVAITQSDGNTIRSRLGLGQVFLTWTSDTVFSANPTGGLISSFSSYGLSPDLSLKPDIGAPGGSIWSSYPLELGGYASLSGTSMSSPHVAGAVALFLQAHPKTKAADVRTFLQNNAVPKNWWGNPAMGLLDNVNRQGAGMLQIDKAILATSIVTPSKLSLGESQAGSLTKTMTISNNGSVPVTYTLSFDNALSVGKTFAPAFYISDATVTFSSGSVTVGVGASASVNVTINPATGPDKAQYGGYLVFTGSDGSVLRVPFAGFVGDYQSITALAPTTYGFPWLAVLYDGSLYKVTGPDDWVYTLQNGDIPYFLVHFDHQVRSISFKVFNASTGKPVHSTFNTAIYEEYLPRNSTSTGFFSFGWDGTRIQSNGYNGVGYDKNLTKPVPDGQYIVVIKALKALGDPKNPADYETWTSPVIAIDRP